jgi:oligogalacturonide transporter
MYKSNAARSISGRQAIGFGIGDFYGGGQLTLIGTYLVLFWNRFNGMSIGTAQSVVGLSAIISAFAALVFGMLDDNLYRFRIGRRFGRRRFMLLIISPLILVGVLLWIPGLPFAIYVATYILWVALAQLFAACYNPLPGEMTQDFGARTKLSTTRMFISTGSGTLILLSGSAILSHFGEHSSTGYMLLTLGATVLFALAVFACWHSTWELSPNQAGFGAWERQDDGHNEQRHEKIGRAGWRKRFFRIFVEYASTFKIAIFRKHLAMYLLIQVAMDVFGQTFVFFVIYDWNKTAAFASLLLGCSAISLPLMPVFGFALTHIGPKRLYRINFIGCLTGAAWLFAAWRLVGILSPTWWLVFAITGSVFFFGFKSLCGYLPWAIFPFIADVDQIVSRRYRSATFSGVQAFCRQMGSGVATIVVGAVLGWVGFDSAQTTQPSRAQTGLAVLLFGWFAITMIVCWIISTKLTISKRTDGVLLIELARVRSGGKPCEASDYVRSVVESLTGQPYGR